MDMTVNSGVAQNAGVPVEHFNIFLEPGGIISRLEYSIVAHWEQLPEAKDAVCVFLSKYTTGANQCAVVPWMTASAVFFNLNNGILYQLSCITTDNALYMIPQRHHELELLLSNINEVFGRFSCAQTARTETSKHTNPSVKHTNNYVCINAEAHNIRSTPLMRMVHDATIYQDTLQCYTRQQNEKYAKAMQSTREQWEFANALLQTNINVAKEQMLGLNAGK